MKPVDESHSHVAGSSEFVAALQSRHNELFLLNGFSVVRLIGFFEDAEDYYYHLIDCDPSSNFFGKEFYASCVAAIHPLNSILDDDYYDMMEQQITINATINEVNAIPVIEPFRIGNEDSKSS